MDCANSNHKDYYKAMNIDVKREFTKLVVKEFYNRECPLPIDLVILVLELANICKCGNKTCFFIIYN